MEKEGLEAVRGGVFVEQNENNRSLMSEDRMKEGSAPRRPQLCEEKRERGKDGEGQAVGRSLLNTKKIILRGVNTLHSKIDIREPRANVFIALVNRVPQSAN